MMAANAAGEAEKGLQNASLGNVSNMERLLGEGDGEFLPGDTFEELFQDPYPESLEGGNAAGAGPQKAASRGTDDDMDFGNFMSFGTSEGPMAPVIEGSPVSSKSSKHVTTSSEEAQTDAMETAKTGPENDGSPSPKTAMDKAKPVKPEAKDKEAKAEVKPKDAKLALVKGKLGKGKGAPLTKKAAARKVDGHLIPLKLAGTSEPSTDLNLLALQRRLDQVLRQIKACNDAMRRRTPQPTQVIRPGREASKETSSSSKKRQTPATIVAPVVAQVPSTPSEKRSSPPPVKEPVKQIPPAVITTAPVVRSIEPREILSPNPKLATYATDASSPMGAVAVVLKCIRRGIKQCYRIQHALDACATIPIPPPSTSDGAQQSEMGRVAMAKSPLIPKTDVYDVLAVLEVIGLIKPESMSRAEPSVGATKRISGLHQGLWSERFIQWAADNYAFASEPAEALQRLDDVVAAATSANKAPDEKESALRVRYSEAADLALGIRCRGLVWAHDFARTFRETLERALALKNEEGRTSPKEVRELQPAFPRTLEDALKAFGDRVPAQYLASDQLASFQRRPMRRRKQSTAVVPTHLTAAVPGMNGANASNADAMEEAESIETLQQVERLVDRILSCPAPIATSRKLLEKLTSTRGSFAQQSSKRQPALSPASDAYSRGSAKGFNRHLANSIAPMEAPDRALLERNESENIAVSFRVETEVLPDGRSSPSKAVVCRGQKRVRGPHHSTMEPVVLTRSIAWRNVASKFEILAGDATLAQSPFPSPRAIHRNNSDSVPYLEAHNGSDESTYKRKRSETGAGDSETQGGRLQQQSAAPPRPPHLVMPQFRKVRRVGDEAADSAIDDAEGVAEDLSDAGFLARHATALQAMRERVQDIISKHSIEDDDKTRKDQKSSRRARGR